MLDRVVPLVTVALGSAPSSERRGGRRPSARWTLPDRESVLVTSEDGPRDGTVRVSMHRERPTGPDRMPDATTELQALLTGL